VNKIRILLIDDHLVVRDGLRSLLSAEADMEIVGEGGNGRQAVQLARELQPDVIVMDIGMPILNGLEASAQIIGAGSKAKVLILSSYSEDKYVQQLAEAGVAGYLVKETAASELINAVRQIHLGNPYFSPAILKRILGLYRISQGAASDHTRGSDSLTSREQEVLQMIAEGHVNKQIASTLNLSIKTVGKHRQQLMDKLDIHDIAGLTRYAIAHGIVESSGRLAGAQGVGDETEVGSPFDSGG
jgi:DNA-binding NarL/FixJ family response regulator